MLSKHEINKGFTGYYKYTFKNILKYINELIVNYKYSSDQFNRH